MTQYKRQQYVKDTQTGIKGYICVLGYDLICINTKSDLSGDHICCRPEEIKLVSVQELDQQKREQHADKYL